LCSGLTAASQDIPQCHTILHTTVSVPTHSNNPLSTRSLHRPFRSTAAAGDFQVSHGVPVRWGEHGVPGYGRGAPNEICGRRVPFEIPACPRFEEPIVRIVAGRLARRICRLLAHGHERASTEGFRRHALDTIKILSTRMYRRTRERK
jgi:hypothetical protein